MNATKPLPKRIVRRGLDVIDAQPTAKSLLRKLSLLGVVHRSIWSRLSADPEFAISLRAGKLKYVYEPHDQVANSLFWRGDYEAETSRVFLKLARDARVVIDVGANTGFFTLLACLANNASTVISFEPVPRIFDILSRNVHVNDWQDRCDLRRNAVADRCGQTQFHVPFSKIPTSASLNLEGFRGYDGQLIDARVETIDAVCRQYEHVDLVKIDVEGFEHKVLEGMTDTLERHHPNLILECNCDGPRKQIEEILGPFGYHFFSLQDHGIVPLKHIDPDPNMSFRNFLCSVDPSIPERLST